MPQDFSPGHDERDEQRPGKAAPDYEDGEFNPRERRSKPHRLRLPRLTLLPVLLALFALQLGAAAWSAGYDLIYDEASHLSIARSLVEGKGYGFVGTAAADSFRPPLIPVLDAVLFAATGPSLFAARLLSAVFAIAAALLLGALARKLWGPGFFFPTALLFAATPLVWFYATKAMVEAPLLLLVSALLYSLFSIRAAPESWRSWPESTTQTGWSASGPRWLVPTLALTAALFLAKYTSLLFIPIVALLLIHRHGRALAAKPLRTWLLLGIAAALALLALFAAAIGYNPISAPQTHLASSSGFATHADAYYLTWALPLLLLAFAPLALYGLFSLAKLARTSKEHRNLLLAILLILAVFIAALSALEVKRDRYLLPALPGLLLAAAWGFSRLHRRFGRAAAALLALLIIVNLVAVPIGLAAYPKADRFTALAAAGPTLQEHCHEPVYTNVYPIAFWYTSQPTKPLETLSPGAPGCVLLDGTVAAYPALEPLLAERSLLFKHGEVRVYA